MYLILGTVLVVIVILFWNIIYTVITKYTSGLSSSGQIGNIWFVGLLIINIAVIIFIYGFYSYKINAKGLAGKVGEPGFVGYNGDECVITISNNIGYKEG